MATKISNSNNIFSCSLCKKVYKFKTTLERHVQWKHSGVESKVHCCDICKKKFHFKNVLSRHITEVHAGITYKCEICDEIFTRRNNLQTHVSNIHNENSNRAPLPTMQCY